MDVLPSGGIFRELQVVHDTGFLTGHDSLEDDWNQVSGNSPIILHEVFFTISL